MKYTIYQIGDVHLCANLYDVFYTEYYLNFNKCFLDILEDRRNNLDKNIILVVNGDLFDNDNPNIESINFAIENFNLLKKNNITILGLNGNHDEVSPAYKISTLNLLNNANVFTKYDSNEAISYETEDINITLISYNRSADILREKLNDAALLAKKDKINLLFSHFAVNEFFTFVNFIELKDIPTIYYQYVGLSDLHALDEMEKQLGKCKIMYSGATFHTDVLTSMIKRKPSYARIDIDNGILNSYHVELPQPEIITITDDKDIDTLPIKNNIILIEDIKLKSLIKRHNPKLIIPVTKNEKNELSVNGEITYTEYNKGSLLQLIEETINSLQVKDDIKDFILKIINKNPEEKKNTIKEIESELDLLFESKKDNILLEEMKDV